MEGRGCPLVDLPTFSNFEFALIELLQPAEETPDDLVCKVAVFLTRLDEHG